MMRAFFLAISLALVVVQSAYSQDDVIDSDDFDSMVFEGLEMDQGPDAALQKQAELEISRIDLACGLRAEQKARLRLAGSGDIKRFRDQLVKARHEYLARDRDNDGGWNMAWRFASPLNEQLSKGLFHKGSLLQKVALHSLDADQLANWQNALLIADKQHAEAMVMMFVSKLQTVIPMTFRQRSQLTELILEGIEVGRERGHESFANVYMQFAKVPKAKYEAIFDENQMKVISQLLEMLNDELDLDEAEMEMEMEMEMVADDE